MVDEICKRRLHSETKNRACMEVPLDVRGGDFTEKKLFERQERK